MFNFFNHKKSDKSLAIVKKIYKNMNSEFRNKIFYGEYENAHEILMRICKILQNETVYDIETALPLCNNLYLQVWIRKHGGFSPDFMKTQSIKESLKQSFQSINSQTLFDMIDECIHIIYSKEPEIQERDVIFESLETICMQNTEKNKEVELLHINDEDYGLVLHKPVFVNGFGNDTAFLDTLCTESGEELTYLRLESREVEGINGPVDVYDMSKKDGETYGILFVCIYGSTMPTNIPKGYAVKK